MLYGTWGYNSSYGSTFGNANTSVLWSHYAYRGVPLLSRAPWCAHYESRDKRTMMSFTRPGQHARMGAPLFRTQKELGNRSVVVDTFSKGGDYGKWTDALGRDITSFPAVTTTQAGMGLKAHRQAYNVLYGDGHAVLYGDPQEKIIWHNQGNNPQSQYMDPFNIMATNFWYSIFGPWADVNGASNEDSAYWKYSSAKVWHDFDVAACLDVW
jgi:prepilin-type processing-associated H-X9-DG protein